MTSVQLVELVHLVVLAVQVFLDRLFLEVQEPPAPQDCLVRKVFKVRLVVRVLMVLKARKVNQVLLVLWEVRVHPEFKVLKETRV